MEIAKYIWIFFLLSALSSCYETADEKPVLSLTTDLHSINEANNTALLEVWLSDRALEDVVVRVDFSGNAIPGVDYVPVAEKLTFTAGYISRTIPVKTIDNSLLNEDRFIELSLSVDETNAQFVNIHEDLTHQIAIIDNEILVSLSLQGSNNTPVRMVLKRKYNDLVVYPLGRTDPITSTGSLGIDGSLSDSDFEVFLEPATAISKQETLDYNLSFSGYEMNLVEAGTCIFSGQEAVKILTFKKTFNGIEILNDD